jgi:hypothetical protein
MYSKGISWIDDCRIPFVDGGWGVRIQETKNMFGSKGLETNTNGKQNDNGRFPANILVSDDMLNDGVISKSGKLNTNLLNIKGARYNNNSKEKLDYGYERGFNDKGTNSRYYDIDKWFDKIIDG